MFPQVLRSLKALESEPFGNGAVVEVRDLDYNLLSFEEQIKNDLETDIMVTTRSSHGSSGLGAIWLPPLDGCVFGPWGARATCVCLFACKYESVFFFFT